MQIDADLLNPKIDNPITIASNLEDFINTNIKTIYPSIKHSVEGQIRSQAETKLLQIFWTNCANIINTHDCIIYL